MFAIGFWELVILLIVFASVVVTAVIVAVIIVRSRQNVPRFRAGEPLSLCPSCGRPPAPSDTVCPHCGADLQKPGT